MLTSTNLSQNIRGFRGCLCACFQKHLDRTEYTFLTYKYSTHGSEKRAYRSRDFLNPRNQTCCLLDRVRGTMLHERHLTFDLHVTYGYLKLSGRPD